MSSLASDDVGVHLNNAEAVGSLAEHQCACCAKAPDSFVTQKNPGALGEFWHPATKQDGDMIYDLIQHRPRHPYYCQALAPNL